MRSGNNKHRRVLSIPPAIVAQALLQNFWEQKYECLLTYAYCLMAVLMVYTGTLFIG
jgi:hypothetical protein